MSQNIRTALLVPFVLMWANPLSAEDIDIDIHGMTCPFCVYSLQRNLGELPDIVSADVSLKQKKVRIKSRGDKADIERIKQTVLDSGFTPMKVTPVPDAQ